MNKRITAVITILILGGAATGGYFLYPQKYVVTGMITDPEGNPAENISISTDLQETQTDKYGKYEITTLNSGVTTLNITLGDSFTSPNVTVDLTNAENSGFKSSTLTKNIQLEYNVGGFVEQVLTNQKFSRHNLIWPDIDQPSQAIFQTQAAYEKFFRALFDYYPGANLKSFNVRADKISKRDTWTSPQGAEYTNVFEVPVEKEFNDGSSDSDIFYVVVIDGELKTTSGLDKEVYDEARQTLIDAGYLKE